MEEQEKQIKKKWKAPSFIVGIVLFISYCTLLVILMYLQWGLEQQRYYLDGFNGTFEGLARTFYSFFVLLGTIPIFILMFVNAFFLKSMIKSYPVKNRIKIGFLILLILLNPIFLFISVSNANGSNHKKFTEGYRDWAKSVLDIQEIREWMLKCDDGTISIGNEKFQGPKCLTENHSRLNAGMIFSEDNGQVLRIMSGGGFQDWGIVIGPKEMEVPESTYFEYYENCGEYRLKLSDGAYVYYERQ